jgi:two-component system, cell cycle sensor histidine kinase PleC
VERGRPNRANSRSNCSKASRVNKLSIILPQQPVLRGITDLRGAMLRVLSCVTEQHDGRLVALAIFICLLAFFTTLCLYRRSLEASAGSANLWLAGSALVFGSGVWTTHFVAMLAFQPGMPIGYDIRTTFLSLAVAALLGWVGLWLAGQQPKLALAGGAVSGGAVGIMHYIGMAAVLAPGVITWERYFVYASLIVGVGGAATALKLAARGSTINRIVLASAVLAVAIVGLHFIAMTAATLQPDPRISLPDELMAPEWLAVAVTAVAVLIMVIGLLFHFYDRQLTEGAARVAELEATKKQLEFTTSELTASIIVRQKAENEIRAAHDELKAATEVARIAFWWRLLTDEGIEQWSGEVESIFGRPAAELGRDRGWYFDLLHPADRDRVVRSYRAALASWGRYESEHRIILAGDSTVWLHEVGEVKPGENGEPPRFVGVVKDITARKQSEQQLLAANERAKLAQAQLRDALDSMSDGFVLCDAGDHIALVNDSMIAMFPTLAHLLQPRRRLHEFLHAGASQGVFNTGDVSPDACAAGWIISSGSNDRIEHQLTDGRWIRASYRRTRGDGFVCLWSDITRLKNQEEQLRSSIADLELSQSRLQSLTESWRRLSEDRERERDQATLANRAKSEFLASMSHELRTPLNSILGFSQIMKSELFGSLGTDQYRGYIGNIHESGSHLLSLINDVLDLAKIESGKLDLHEERCDLEQICRSVLQLMKERARECGVRLRLECRRAVPAIRGDERKLKQILFNLLSNAIKFTPKGGSAIISLGIDLSGDIELAVADTGIGIAPDQIQRVLEPFTQVESVYNRRHSGTGLGLTLAKELAELHGAEFDLISKEGKGSTVTVKLPKWRIINARDDEALATLPQSARSAE